MSEFSTSRTYELIEELRAEIDFELEDVITEIVRELPEDYFERIKRDDQIIHLKALLALSFCKLQEELMFRSGDGVHIAVIARQNYSGQLANILSRLPREQRLIGANIFTSRSHNFIIDLFEFEAATDSKLNDKQAENALLTAAEKIALNVDADVESVAEFLSHCSHNSQMLEHTASLTEHFLVYQQLCATCKTAMRVTKTQVENQIKITAASRKIDARGLVHRVAEYLGQQNLNIERSFLNDLLFEEANNVAIASFVLDSQSVEGFTQHSKSLSKLLEESID